MNFWNLVRDWADISYIRLLPVILPGAVVGLYSGVRSAIILAGCGFRTGDVFFEVSSCTFESEPEGPPVKSRDVDGVLRLGGDVTLWCVGEVTTLLPGEVILRGGDVARGVELRDLGVPVRLGVPVFPDLSFKLPLLGVLALLVTWNKSASKSSKSCKVWSKWYQTRKNIVNCTCTITLGLIWVDHDGK